MSTENPGAQKRHNGTDTPGLYAPGQHIYCGLDEDRVPYLGEPSVPREEWPEICRRALEYRENNRNYIQQCKEWLEI